MTRRPLILDTDGGVDDAQAVLMLIAHGVVPHAITTVFGNVSVETATANVLAVLAHAGVEVPVHPGQARPLTAPAIDAVHIHGNDGLGGAPRPGRTAAPASRDAVSVLVDLLSEAEATDALVDVLAIGPLTNLALALRLRPAIAGGIGRLTIMGGTLSGRGNTTPAAEFNVLADPEAAAVVFGADIPTTVVPWETYAGHFLSDAEMDAIFEDVPNHPVKAFSLALATHARRINAVWAGADVFRIVDPFAAAVVIDPAVITASLNASVDVALAPGIARGMCVVDPSGRLGTPPVTLVEAGDLERLHDLYAASVRWHP